MISTLNSIPLGKNNEENLKRGTAFFPCSGYAGDIHNYITNYLPPHWHHEMELFILDEGIVSVTSAGGDFILREEEGYFSNSNALHGIYPLTESPCRYHSIVFDPSIISGAPGSAFDLLYTKPFIDHSAPVLPLYHDTENYSEIISLFENAFTACKNEPAAYEFTIRENLSQILLKLIKLRSRELDSSVYQYENRIKLMLTFMEDNYADSITVTEIAAAAGIGRRECQRTFHSVLHTTPVSYLMNYRLSKAADMLISTGLTIAEISIQNGFNDPSYFSKQFKSAIGLSPQKYRKMDKNTLGSDR